MSKNWLTNEIFNFLFSKAYIAIHNNSPIRVFTVRLDFKIWDMKILFKIVWSYQQQ